MTIVERLLDRLESVRRTGRNRWMARCPAHDDRGPSLSIRECDDGPILLHCFAGCGAAEVLTAIGLDFSDLYPERSPHGDGGHRRRPERKPFPASDILLCVAHEALVVASAAALLIAGYPMTAIDRERLILAAERLQAAISMSGVRHD